ncbi:MAG: GntR family transcriptional regulator [Mesorhizobium sp.]|uniref:GntR family transcriptional regulator n=1 Tax=Mesorhizobium sp. TaxID=1871066 RepID=UPI0011FB5CF2|nr:GntR family transcriptional regulator [Mesorhizobium sp.]TIU72046.1 MAG: GntR family transcriptional regulator [Mesorhizobium sp.]TIW10441.1 MAG: GntR family transcriptional regulator [Mesorhizobium sp.]TIW71547.1 MAG: GntR family transcriptional regulator [Mesorhizobium sp.]TIX73533.1 MAG: GntR family transcriptional regulator [Mesorhizobium sp.]
MKARESQTLEKTFSLRPSSKLPDVLGLELSNIIEHRIVYMEIMPGTHLTEQELCDEFQVSRSPVREAFRQLEANGLVVRHTRRGVRVTPMTETTLHNIYTCRVPLEGLAASNAALNATEDDLLSLEASLASMAKAMPNHDPRISFDSSVAFIDTIHRAAKNDVLIHLLSIVTKQALRYRYFAYLTSPSMIESSLPGLEAIFEAIKSRSATRAEAAARSVLEDTENVIMKALRTQGPKWKMDATSNS